jgi:two-component system alkaline phosphatase synthesis response regulator PhoP
MKCIQNAATGERTDKILFHVSELILREGLANWVVVCRHPIGRSQIAAFKGITLACFCGGSASTKEIVMKKILIVDDEPHIRALLEQALEEFEDEGVEIHLAVDGEDAINVIKKEKPDLVFLDVMMPKIDGFEVCRIIKKELGLSNVYVIMLTAQGQEFDKQLGKKAGADIYMTKPFNPDDIVSKAAEVLQIQL